MLSLKSVQLSFRQMEKKIDYILAALTLSFFLTWAEQYYLQIHFKMQFTLYQGYECISGLEY